MRILFLSPSGHMGGAEQVLWDILRGLQAAKPDWQIRLIAATDGNLMARTRAIGIDATLHPFPSGLAKFGDNAAKKRGLSSFQGLRAGLQSLRYISTLRRTILEFQPDVIHSNGLKMHLLGARAKTQKPKLIWHLHDFAGNRSIIAHLLRVNRTKCNLVIANSHAVTADFLAHCSRHSQVRTIHNAVDVSLFSPEGNRADLDALSGLTPATSGTVRVGLVATMAWWKGHKIFLQALSKLPADVPFRAYIVGDAIYETFGSQTSIKELRQLADTLNLGERVGFTGFVSDIPAVMRALDIVVHASTAPEPFGRVVIEAMACGRPVISTCNGGTREIIEIDEDTLFYPSQDSASLATAIVKLAENPELRKKMGQAGRQKAVCHFSQERFICELIDSYSNIITRT